MHKNKVGIVTFHTAINYGAVLQAYALNKKINSLGVKCDTIDYRCPAIDFQYKYRSWKKSTSWQNFIAQNLTCFLHSKKKKNFKKFRNRLSLSKPCTTDNISDVAKEYNVFITGSDQVFNPVCHKSDPAFFLDFAKQGDKNCYAASLGSIEQFNRLTFDAKQYLKDFKNLSFRENDAAQHISGLLDRDCKTVMDPVWFLDKNGWGEIAYCNEKKPYIFVYNLMDYKYLKAYAKKLSKMTGYRIISVSRTIMGDFMFAGTKNRSNCSPEEFLGYIKNAEYVVTDSFHGTSLSVLLQKKVCVALNPSKNNTNSRLDNILGLTGLTDRIIDKDTLECNLGEIDYQQVENKIKVPIEESEEFLKSIIF